MWVRSAVTKWQPEWPMEFPGVLPSTRINRIGRENAAGTRAAQLRPRRR